MERRAFIQMLIGGSLFGFLFGQGTEPAQALLRPPGAEAEEIFLSSCARCGKCAEICPLQAIEIAHGEKGLSIGTPYLTLQRQPCDFCMNCTAVCTSGALRPVEKEKAAIGLAAIDKDRCFAWQGDECKICYTSCPRYDQAIRLQDHKYPVVDATFCNGCGQCEHVCIASPPAIRVLAKK